MDEEQGLASPLAGGLRGIRRSISSNVFGGGRRQTVQAQPDTITTNLLQQNSLSLENISTQLNNISAQVSGLNGSLLSIKENLAVSDQLERQREAATVRIQNRLKKRTPALRQQIEKNNGYTHPCSTSSRSVYQ